MAGRPPIFETPEDMQAAVDEYFESTEIYTVAGLALALGMDRRTLLNYEKNDEFIPTVKRAKLRIEQFVEEMLYLGKNAAGPIFNLKNNFGYEDAMRQDVQFAVVSDEPMTAEEWAAQSPGHPSPDRNTDS